MPKKAQENKYQYWCGGIYDKDFKDKCDQLSKSEDCPFQYIVTQLEICPKTGKPHWQTYIEWKTRVRFQSIKKAFNNDTLHLEPRRSTQEKARNYCMKSETREDGPYEFGNFVPNRAGQRNDLMEVKEALDEGKSMEHIAQEHFCQWVRHNRSFEKYQAMLIKPRDFKTEVRVYWGEPGSGKSQRAHQEALSFASFYYLPKCNAGGQVWWDGYEGQECVVVDDFYGWLKMDQFLRLCDQYPHRVEYKGGSRQFTSKCIIFTSNKDPMLWYEKHFETHPEHVHAFSRRIEVIEQMYHDKDKCVIPRCERCNYKFII